MILAEHIVPVSVTDTITVRALLRFSLCGMEGIDRVHLRDLSAGTGQTALRKRGVGRFRAMSLEAPKCATKPRLRSSLPKELKRADWCELNSLRICEGKSSTLSPGLGTALNVCPQWVD
jgi:hypothetical protein